MNLKAKFLTLSMKEQICITIIALDYFCFLVLLSICGSLANEILREDYNQKKLYFYDKYKKYVESCFYFQNFCILQYEEILKRTQKQIWDHLQVSSKYNFNSNFKNFANNKLSKVGVSSYYPINDTLLNSTNNDELLFYTCFDSSESSIGQCSTMVYLISNLYSSLSSLTASHDIDNSFRIPYYNIPIFDTPIIYNINRYTMFSFDSSKMIQRIHEICGNEFSLSKIYNYFDNKLSLMINNVKNKLIFFFKNKHNLILHLFEKIINEIINQYHITFSNYIYESLAYEATGYFTVIDYSNDNFYLINILDDYYFFYYIESNIIKDYLYFINSRLSFYIDMYFIPLNIQNDTLINPDLCILFLLKQLDYYTDQNKVDELYEKIKKGKSKIEECFLDIDILKSQPEIRDILNLSFNDFLFVSNYTINEGILNLQNSPYYYIKFTTPNYNSLKDFKSDYFILDQVNYYLFASFRDVIKYTDLLKQVSLNCFCLIILLISFTWSICLFVNIFIFFKVTKQLTEPFKKLQEAVDSSSIKDEKNFNYEYDEIINELFITCKELISGKIDNSNNENGLSNFNILSLPKDMQKDIEENRYLKNLIINNDLMNQLIMQQQTMMDFSKNIRLNEFNSSKNDDNNDIEKNISSIRIQNMNINNSAILINDNTNNLNTINNNKTIKNEAKEIEDREPYKKLCQISQYLYYYQNKTDNNYIQISGNDNVVKDESQMSKFSRNKIKKDSIKINEKLYQSIRRGDSNVLNDNYKNLSINMINNRSLPYLWYMEAKQKKNKSLNYKIGDNFEELFKEYCS